MTASPSTDSPTEYKKIWIDGVGPAWLKFKEERDRRDKGTGKFKKRESPHTVRGTPDELAAVVDYTGTHYSLVNGKLRDLPPEVTGADVPPEAPPNYGAQRVNEIIDHLDSLMAKQKPVERSEFAVWRGTEEKALPPNLKVGDEWSDPGYMSTSSDRAVSADFPLEANSSPKRLKIWVSPGARVLSVVEQLPANIESRAERARENEHLFPRGTRFVVEAIEGRNITMRVVVE